MLICLSNKLLKKSFKIFLASFAFFSATVYGLIIDGAEVDISRGNLRYRLGQMLIIGFHDSVFSEQSTIAKAIRDNQVGGVILYNHDGKRNIKNPAQLTQLNKDLKNYAAKHSKVPNMPLIISMDQEGGKVSRLPASQGFKNSDASPAQLGMRNDPQYTEKYAAELAAYMHQLGVNVNFAPSVDVAINPDNFIVKKERTFSSDPEIVYKQAHAFINGMHVGGVLATLKHFPGHASSSGDTHEGFVDVTETWSSDELIPYRKLIKEGYADLIMTAHTINGQLHDDTCLNNKDGKCVVMPATYSKQILTDLLRDELGFKGVVVTDDLTMGGASKNYTLHQILKYSVNAGVDLLIISNHKQDATGGIINTMENFTKRYEDIATAVVDTLEQLVLSGEIKLARINEAYGRIQQLKKKILQFDQAQYKEEL